MQSRVLRDSFTSDGEIKAVGACRMGSETVQGQSVDADCAGVAGRRSTVDLTSSAYPLSAVGRKPQRGADSTSCIYNTCRSELQDVSTCPYAKHMSTYTSAGCG
jgi:hypothetical protein